MRNQKAINEVMFKGAYWKWKGEGFHCEKYISRKPFGQFKVSISISQNGLAGVTISNVEYPELQWGGLAAGYEGAMACVVRRFKRIDDLIESLSKQTEEAEKQRKRAIAEAINAALNKKENSEEKGK